MTHAVSYLKNPELITDGTIVIEDPAGLPPYCNVIQRTILTSGKGIIFPMWLTGGGQVYKKYFLEAIGDKKYTNAYEWCAGHGEIGFELITNGICKTLAFSDAYDKSAEWCLRNAQDLGLADAISAYTTPRISNIPATVKWDLVVGNPPNSLGVDYTEVKKHRLRNLSEDHLRLHLRTTMDCGFVAHREFFENIKNFIIDDADIFLTVNNRQQADLEKFSIPCGFEIVKKFDMFPDELNLKIFQFKQV